jgi:undecaprenyl-diphosphatase
MSILQSIVLGIIEGITEFLPISSTAHLILVARLFGIQQESEFVKSFEIAIQFGAILAVIVLLYWQNKKLLLNIEYLKKIVVALLPTVILGFIFYGVIKSFLLENNSVIVGSLLIGGIIIVIFEILHREKKDAIDDIKNISYINCFIIGLFQSIAMIPGVSRAAATIIGGLVLGVKRKTIVEFSFLLAIPTMLGATTLDLIKTGNSFSVDEFGILAIGFAVSFIFAAIFAKFLLWYIGKYNFIPFGIYRILIGFIFLFILVF